MDETIDGNEAIACPESTVIDVLEVVQQKVGDIPATTESKVLPQGTHHGNFRSSTNNGEPIALWVSFIPIQSSRRGEVSVVQRLKPKYGNNFSSMNMGHDTDYYVFNEGGKLALAKHSYADSEIPNFHIADSDPDGRRLSLEEQALMLIDLRNKWKEEQMEKLRTSGRATVTEREARDLIAELERGQRFKR